MYEADLLLILEIIVLWFLKLTFLLNLHLGLQER